jgi:hypothetical protein
MAQAIPTECRGKEMSERYRIIQTTNRLFTIEQFIAGSWHVLPPLRGGYFFASDDEAMAWLTEQWRNQEWSVCQPKRQTAFC